jgi:hypothetical protein
LPHAYFFFPQNGFEVTGKRVVVIQKGSLDVSTSLRIIFAASEGEGFSKSVRSADVGTVPRATCTTDPQYSLTARIALAGYV